MMTSEQRDLLLKQKAEREAKRPALVRWFCNLNSLEKTITVIVATPILISSAWVVQRTIELNDKEALQQSLQIQSQQIKSEMFPNPYTGN
jgi:hypothetical protein